MVHSVRSHVNAPSLNHSLHSRQNGARKVSSNQEVRPIKVVFFKHVRVEFRRADVAVVIRQRDNSARRFLRKDLGGNLALARLYSKVDHILHLIAVRCSNRRRYAARKRGQPLRAVLHGRLWVVRRC